MLRLHTERIWTNTSQQMLPIFRNFSWASRTGSIWKSPKHHFSSNQSTTRKWKFKIRWLVIPTFVGAGYYGYREVVKVKDQVAKQWQVNLYTLLPMNLLSRAWGKVNNIDLPVWMRGPFYKLYIRTFHVNLEEAVIEDLKEYPNLGEFFKRKIKPSTRPIDQSHSLVSPCDGKVLHFGLVEDGWVEQVKGVKYSLPAFLGPADWSTGSDKHPTGQPVSESDYETRVRTSPDTQLYHCVIYLAPGDYHGFHAPTQWTVSLRRHFPGSLLSVNPVIARKVAGLFHLNERAVYTGRWQHGFLSMTAVGATNVGSIRVYVDQSLQTNCKGKKTKGTYHDKLMSSENNSGLKFEKGQEFGEFNLGSTIVLIFEAPKNFKFKIENGQKIKLGQPVGCDKS